MNARVSAGARVFSLPQPVRNVLGFLCGWLFIMALAFGMEAAHAIEFKGVGDGNLYGFTIEGSSGADICEQLRATKQSAGSSTTIWTVKSSASLTRTSVSGLCMLNSATPTNVAGTDRRAGATYFSRCNSADGWVLIQPGVSACEPDVCISHASGTKMSFTGQGQVPGSVCWGDCTFQLDDDTSTGTCTGTPPARVCVGQVNAVSSQDSSGQTSYGGNYVSTGAYCDQSVVPTTPPSSTNPVCVPTKAGQVCTGGDIPKHCATVDGSMTCFSDAGDICDTPECFASGDAVRNSNGTAIAKENAPTPKAPNTGTAGVKAPADGTLQVKQRAGAGATFPGSGPTNNYNTYNTTTVANSYNGDGSIGDRTEQEGEGECDPATEECPGEGDGDGEGECDPQTEICGDGEFNSPTNEYGFGDLDADLQSARDSLTQKITEVRAQASQMLGGGLPEGGGSLPVAQFEVLGHAFTIDLGIYADKLALVGTLILFAAMAIAARIILE